MSGQHTTRTGLRPPRSRLLLPREGGPGACAAGEREEQSDEPCFFLVRPAWAHSCGCKSRRKLITTNEVKRNCVRVTERGKEAWSVSREPMDKNWIEGDAEQGERARNRKALVIKAR